MIDKILTWTCPHCKKTLTSLYPEQLEHNKRAHLFIHNNNEVKE